MRSLLLACIILFIASCKGNQEMMQSMTTSLESELKQTDSLFVSLERNPKDSLDRSIDSTLVRLKSVLTDTMSTETEKMLEDYLELDSSLKDYAASLDSLRKELSYSKTQITNLKKDAEQANIDYSKYEESAEKELEALRMIQRNAVKMNDWFKSAQSTVLTANELLNQRISADSLLNHH